MNGYTPIPGFIDLREYKIPKKELKKIWEIQNFLRFVEDEKEYYMEFNQTGWQKAQEMSARYQRILNNYAKTNE